MKNRNYYVVGCLIGFGFVAYFLYTKDKGEFDAKKEEALEYVRMQKENKKDIGLRDD